jgi:hypothetical protein
MSHWCLACLKILIVFSLALLGPVCGKFCKGPRKNPDP